MSIAMLGTPHSLAYCLANLIVIISNPDERQSLLNRQVNAIFNRCWLPLRNVANVGLLEYGSVRCTFCTKELTNSSTRVNQCALYGKAHRFRYAVLLTLSAPCIVKSQHMNRKLRLTLIASFASLHISLTTSVFSQETKIDDIVLADFFELHQRGLHPKWQLSGLPDRKTPLTRFEPVQVDGESVLSLRTQASYGVLTHRWQGRAPTFLNWRWRLDQSLPNADIKIKAGDDAALKVCVMFDQPQADIPFLQRATLVLARRSTAQDLPNATLCYLWDSRYPTGTHGANPYTDRVRFLVLEGTESAKGQWVQQRRRIADDFALLFGQESKIMPPIIAVAVGADSDNTRGSSLGYLTRLSWQP